LIVCRPRTGAKPAPRTSGERAPAQAGAQTQSGLA
jgi:hypothetical protein